MSDDNRRTRLPDAEADGAGNFGAEPDIDANRDPIPEDAGERVYLGMPSAPNPIDVPLEDEGNRTGGEPVEDIQERQADSTADSVAGSAGPDGV